MMIGSQCIRLTLQVINLDKGELDQQILKQKEIKINK